ncbi:hypothetical protein AGABI1DRAFT_125559 [Agaricus bisporus var. burnettii JB137-S8]|uniref:Uncharacterized protein n=1 Tax=Agaricus bisporus var. burnettii (strain JB137-S8 / ATCC MYA-4627 / FGSC 10392) TaxID=597362 RepID=K5W8C4_AGABU|nr:uncharacterized protein AGABI1DRAFT_125559 [Agaricus bisporus var. burnettii JB137-S8]EKM83079.1 hypothetical protein AGABI1DRAFT_125559 [Agaricus bisporus var. burnettii JB137-S8]
MFSTIQGYIIMPQRRAPDESGHLPDFVIEVDKIASPIPLRTVLMVKIKNTRHCEAGIPAFERQMLRQTIMSENQNAPDLVTTAQGLPHPALSYWIGTPRPDSVQSG